jgi:predicted outer membrane repeat protein
MIEKIWMVLQRTSLRAASAASLAAVAFITGTASLQARAQDLPPELPQSVESASSEFTAVSVLDRVDAAPGNGVCADSNGVCTLRAAVMEANAHAGPDSIALLADTYFLSIDGDDEDESAMGDLDITGILTITGQGRLETVIDAASLERIFDIFPGAQVVLSALTLQKGLVNGSGGGIQNYGGLEISDCRIQDNTSGNYGGGIANQGNGTLLVRDCIFQENTSTAWGGGGIFANGDVELTRCILFDNLGGGGSAKGGGLAVIGNVQVNDSLIDDNYSNGSGGGIYLAGGNLTVSNTTIRNNRTVGDGGGIRNLGGDFTAVNTTFSNNQAGGSGGAVKAENLEMYVAPSFTLVNSTLSGNRAADHGGGLMITSGTLVGSNITIADNSANFNEADTTGTGGGIKRTGGTVGLRNSILANNIHLLNGFAEADDCSGLMVVFRYSLVNATTGCTFTNQNTLTGVNALLQPLAYNGGSTQTHALRRNSPAVDAADPAGCKNDLAQLITLDQRGQPRHLDSELFGPGICDMGAYELSPAIFLPLTRR